VPCPIRVGSGGVSKIRLVLAFFPDTRNMGLPPTVSEVFGIRVRPSGLGILDVALPILIPVLLLIAAPHSLVV
jgi:hypothetical protein